MKRLCLMAGAIASALALDAPALANTPARPGAPAPTRIAGVQLHSFPKELDNVGQVSKFVQRGAVRIASDRWVSDFTDPHSGYGFTTGLDDVALENPDGSKVLVAYDNSTQPIEFQVSWRGQAFSYTLAARAMVTFTWH